MPQINLKNTRLYITDGTPSAQFVEVIIGDGNVSWTENRTIEYAKNRGKLSSADGGVAREGDDNPVSVSFDIRWDEFTSDDSSVTPVEAIQNVGQAITDTWLSVDSDNCTPYAVNLELIRDLGVCFVSAGGGTGTDRYEKYLFTSFRWESMDYDVDAGTMAVSGTCQVTTVTATRVAADPTPT